MIDKILSSVYRLCSKLHRLLQEKHIQYMCLNNCPPPSPWEGVYTSKEFKIW